MKNLVSVADVQKAIKLGYPKAKSLVAGLEPAVELGNAKGYHLEEVQEAVWDEYSHLLVFLGLPASRSASQGLSELSEV